MTEIKPEGKWQLYSPRIPAGSRAVGVVTVDGWRTGALVLIEATGLYVQANDGALRGLDQHQVDAALARAGGSQ